MALITATLTVNFAGAEGGGANDRIILEIDGRESIDGGFNAGRTSGFAPNSTVWFFLFRSSAVSLLSVGSNRGAIGLQSAAVNLSQADDIIVQNSDSVTLPKPANGAVAASFAGRVFNSNGVSITPPAISQVSDSELSIETAVSGVISYSYISTPRLYFLTGVPAQHLTAQIFAFGSTPD